MDWLEEHDGVMVHCIDPETSSDTAPSVIFWEFWPGSKDVPEVVRKKLTVKAKKLKENIYSGIPKLNAEIARLIQIELSLGECVDEVITENYNLDICSSRKETMLRTLVDFNRQITCEVIAALAARIPWLACLTGSALSHLMDNLRKGIAYMHYVEEVTSAVMDRRKVVLMDRARGSFLAHALKELSCTAERAALCKLLVLPATGLGG